MSTPAQIEANRQNAQRSTGPTTDEGKQTSSRNAVRHGILARVVPAQTPGFDELLRGLYESLRPRDEAQRFLVDQIAVTIVRLQRVGAAEERYLQLMVRPGSDGMPVGAGVDDYLRGKSAPLALRYEAGCNRLIQRNLKLLRDMKSEWQWRAARKGDCPYLESVPVEEAVRETEQTVEEALPRKDVVETGESNEIAFTKIAYAKTDAHSEEAKQSPALTDGSKLASFRKNDMQTDSQIDSMRTGTPHPGGRRRGHRRPGRGAPTVSPPLNAARR